MNRRIPESRSAMTNVQTKPSRMLAGQTTPWVSVSLLAEHVFCPRAAVIQHEANEEDTGEEQDRFRLGWGKPPTFYSFVQIHRELKRLQQRMLWTGLATVVAILVSLQLPLLWIAVLGIGGTFIAFLLRWLSVFFLQYL